ncbi:MauE/DoxX family redox-associated membrane protein [Flavobacterium degerlachei]|uniref:Methylamine utilisation protein MauE domain-containing protein n=1 Tax=Flavobacterium degerlachei TaxID=229203 RepID=A0A1H3EA34_9FLAO|nr:MauE/DoxX family redox-associated membrane protein [Flavobacterium degerlachei]SDX74784.1 hypothetical protein SAMN05444338_11469 [Flavobacterium degerlachei]
MRLNTKIQNVLFELICSLYILLFVYAAISKLLDFENFRVQLGQSPLLSAFAGWISWGVPIVELFICLLLIFPKWRIFGLFSALSLMTMFTAYIFILLNYSSFVPCSCGGILEKLGWTEHLIFNLFFVLLAVLGLLLGTHQNNSFMGRMKPSFYFLTILFSLLFSVGAVVVLFVSSEEIMHHENPFIRRYPHHPIALTHTADLKFNSYYFAGYANDRVYLGNYTDPLHVLSMDTTLQHRQILKIAFDRTDIPFRMAKVLVRAPYFYLMDGTVPTIFRGDITDWKVRKELKGCPNFTLAEPIDSITIAFRSNSSKNGAHVLGFFSSGRPSKIHCAPQLLQKQIDGIFDTDGMLQYSKELNRIVYVYFYRNQFIVADKNATLDYRGNTIDTVAHAKIKIAYLKGKTERKMAAPPLTVNAHTAICNNLLFVHSKVPGRYENNTLWKQASIIDVYDLKKNAYVMSFPVYKIDNKELQSLFVTSTHLYALIGTQLVIYELNAILQNEIKSVEREKT